MSIRTNMSAFQNAIISWVSETNLIKDLPEADMTLPDVIEFFNAFKRKIRYNIINDFDLSTFLQEFYPSFEFHSEDHFEQIYVYSLLLHFSCVDLKDQFFQKACLNICHSHQTMIHKFLNILIDRQEFDKESLSVMINEASMPVSHGLPFKIVQHMPSGTTPPTPKSLMLNSKMMMIRNLEAELISERNRVEEIEILYEEKLREKQTEIEELNFRNSTLEREILEKESEMASMNCDLEVDKASKGLLKKISEKNKIIQDFQQTIDALNHENDELNEKLCESERKQTENIRTIHELQDTIHSLEDELERQSTKNCALESHVEGLNSFIVNSRRLDNSIEVFNFLDKDLCSNNNNNNNNINEKSKEEIHLESSPPHHSPIVKKRSFSIDIQSSLPMFRQRNRNFYRSTTYKESERYLSIADEILASGNTLEHDPEIDDKGHDDTQLSVFFDSLHEGRRESVLGNKIKVNKKLEKVKEDDSSPEINTACNRLLSKLRSENESLRKANESLALAQLAHRRPKRGFKLCIIS